MNDYRDHPLGDFDPDLDGAEDEDADALGGGAAAEVAEGGCLGTDPDGVQPPNSDGTEDAPAGHALQATPALPAVETRAWTVQAAEHGQRLDKVMVQHAPEFSRSHLQSLVERACVQINGTQAVTAATKLRLGQRVSLQLLPTAQAQAFRAERIPLSVVFEDEHLIVLDKPAGLVVHPAPGHWSGTLLNALLAHHPGAAGLPRAGIVHRLDRDTSGLMVVAKTVVAMQALVRAMAAREVQRTYAAIAWGLVKGQEQDVQAPIGRDPRSRVRMAVVTSGKPSRTTVSVALRSTTGHTAVECRLHTGRTHQIRVHMAYLGHPLVADAVYGGARALGLERQALHARRLTFTHPLSAQPLSFEAPLPEDLKCAWGHLSAVE